MIYRVVRLGHPALRAKSVPVDPKRIQNKPFQKLIDDLIATMRAYGGVGIAAPQIGLAERIFCVECRKNKRYPGMPHIPVYTVINPKLTIVDPTPVGMMEGCLSVPDMRAQVYRAKSVRIEGLDRKGNRISNVYNGFHARILQHEFDHINGKVYLDRVKPADRHTLCYCEYL